jgi:hypothetical protein
MVVPDASHNIDFVGHAEQGVTPPRAKALPDPPQTSNRRLANRTPSPQDAPHERDRA